MLVHSVLCRHDFAPCSAHLKPLLYLQPCPFVDDTISNLLSHVLFERQCKLKCWMLSPSPSLHSLPLRVFLYSYTAECCSKHDFFSELLIYSCPLCSPLCYVCVCLWSLCVFVCLVGVLSKKQPMKLAPAEFFSIH